MSSPVSTAHDVAQRGVYELPFLVAGERVLVAVDSHGEYVKHARESKIGDYACTEAWLDGLLELQDPFWTRPQLMIVR